MTSQSAPSSHLRGQKENTSIGHGWRCGPVVNNSYSSAWGQDGPCLICSWLVAWLGGWLPSSILLHALVLCSPYHPVCGIMRGWDNHWLSRQMIFPTFPHACPLLLAESWMFCADDTSTNWGDKRTCDPLNLFKYNTINFHVPHVPISFYVPH